MTVSFYFESFIFFRSFSRGQDFIEFSFFLLREIFEFEMFLREVCFAFSGSSNFRRGIFNIYIFFPTEGAFFGNIFPPGIKGRENKSYRYYAVDTIGDSIATNSEASIAFADIIDSYLYYRYNR